MLRRSMPLGGKSKRTKPFAQPCLESLEERLLLSVDEVLRWNTIATQAIIVDTTPHGLPFPGVGANSQPGPAATSRAMAIVQIAVYDAADSITQEYTPYMEHMPAATDSNMNAAIAQAAHDALVALYPQQQPTFDTDLASDLAAIPEGQSKFDGIQAGKAAAAAILAARANDGAGAALTAPYTVNTSPGYWQPDPLHPTQKAYAPGWGSVTPFGMQSVFQYTAPPPPAFNSPQYIDAVNQVESLGAVNSTTRTADQTEIGIFWSDESPGVGNPLVQYNLDAQTIAQQEGNTLMENARLFALINIGMADAGIAVWYSKYQYNFWRPIQAVRNANQVNDPGVVLDPNWVPMGAQSDNPQLGGGSNFTPPFPSYVSGHSAFGAAMFQTLINFYGTDDISFTLHSLEYNGITEDPQGNVRPVLTRSYTSFTQAELENSESRVYLGVHYQFDVDVGTTMGTAIGNNDFKLLAATLTPNQLFINEIYLSLLNRRVDSAGLSAWVGLLNQGVSRNQIVLDIENSAEYQSDQVQAMYTSFLNRPADPGGLATFTGQLASGISVEQVEAAILGSQEFVQTQGGGTNSGFLTALYQDVLHRAIDAGGQAFFTQQLTNGVTPTQVAQAVLGSSEYQRDLVDSFYTNFLGRTADSGGEASWIAALQQGMTDQQVIAGFLGSVEYFNRTQLGL